MVDLIIVGGGPAGLTAALYAARKKINFLVVTEELGGQVMWTKDIENYMGYQFVTGQELTAKFEEQLKPLLAADALVYDRVKSLQAKAREITLYTEKEARFYRARSVIIASGKRPRLLNVPGEERLRGRGVSYCATCDGPLFRGKTVAVVGGGNSALQAALELRRWEAEVYLVDRDGYRADAVLVERAAGDDGIRALHRRQVKEIFGEEKVEGILLADAEGKEQRLRADGVFVEIGLVPNTDFARDTVPLNARGEILVDCRCHTKIPGVFAAGDVTNGVDKQIIIAAGDGATAAIAVNDFLFQKNLPI